MKLLNNLNKEQSHVKEFCKCLKTSQKAYISVAFLKMSGLSLIMDALKKFLSNYGELQIIAGQNFGLTEPEALTSLLNLLEDYPESKLYLYEAVSADCIFHPKMYLFESKKGGKIILGSANMTKGGISINNEVSISFECELNSEIWEQSKATFNTYLANSEPVTLKTIRKYKKFYNKQRENNRTAMAVHLLSQKTFNRVTLKEYLEEWGPQKLKKEFLERKKSYQEAVQILNEIADTPRLTETKFIPLLDRLLKKWHSRDIKRNKPFIYINYKEVAKLVRFIRANKSESSDYVFAKAMKQAKDITGVSVNFITEVMISYNPKEFAILNGNPFKVLTEEAGITFKYELPSSFSGKDYAYYCEIIKEISEELGFSNMLEADSFFNEIYWEKKENYTK